nr:3A [Passerivirus A1]
AGDEVPISKAPTCFTNPSYIPGSTEDLSWDPTDIQSSVPTPEVVAVKSNDIGLLKKIWKYKKPLIATATFLSILASVTVLFTSLYTTFRSRSQPQ